MAFVRVGSLICSVLGLLSGGWGCSTSSPAGESAAESLTESAPSWTSREREWFDGESAEDFRASMAHLADEAPLSADRAAAVRRELADWPDDARVAPKKWVDRLVRGEYDRLMEFARRGVR